MQAVPEERNRVARLLARETGKIGFAAAAAGPWCGSYRTRLEGRLCPKHGGSIRPWA